MIANKDFLKIVITSPSPIFLEEVAISALLEEGEIDCVHLRKPDYSAFEMRSLIESIPQHLHPFLRLHDHYELLKDYDLAGVQLNSRHALAPTEAATWSRGCHSLEETERVQDGYCYLTLSPIFDSISKQGYDSARFPEAELRAICAKHPIVALGGVEPCHFDRLRDVGFRGVAMLGYVWDNPEGKSFFQIVKRIRET